MRRFVRGGASWLTSANGWARNIACPNHCVPSIFSNMKICRRARIPTSRRKAKSVQRADAAHFILAERFESRFRNRDDGQSVAHGIEYFSTVTLLTVATN